jgi:hypothetical protein
MAVWVWWDEVVEVVEGFLDVVTTVTGIFSNAEEMLCQ